MQPWRSCMRLRFRPRQRQSDPPAVPDHAPEFVQRVTRLLLEGHGDQFPVSAFPPDGTWPTGTGRYEKRAIALEIPIWEPDLCVQCNRCAMICPHASILAKVYEPAALSGDPQGFPSVPEGFTLELEGLSYTVQVAPDDCTGCGLCVAVCPAKDRKEPRRKAINLKPVQSHQETERARFEFFEAIPDVPRSQIPATPTACRCSRHCSSSPAQCAGCGETPYIRLLTQLFGDRLLLANATGCSSIYGGNLPTTPYTVIRTAAARPGTTHSSRMRRKLAWVFGCRWITWPRAQPHSLINYRRNYRDRGGPAAISLSADGRAALESRRQAVTDLVGSPRLSSPAVDELQQIADASCPKVSG